MRSNLWDSFHLPAFLDFYRLLSIIPSPTNPIHHTRFHTPTLAGSRHRAKPSHRLMHAEYTCPHLIIRMMVVWWLSAHVSRPASSHRANTPFRTASPTQTLVLFRNTAPTPPCQHLQLNPQCRARQFTLCQVGFIISHRVAGRRWRLLSERPLIPCPPLRI